VAGCSGLLAGNRLGWASGSFSLGPFAPLGWPAGVMRLEELATSQQPAASGRAARTLIVCGQMGPKEAPRAP